LRWQESQPPLSSINKGRCLEKPSAHATGTAQRSYHTLPNLSHS